MTTRKLRRLLAPKLDFEFWIDGRRAPSFAVGAQHSSAERRDAILAALTALGYAGRCTGTPGTVGAFTVDVEISDR